MHRVTGTLRRTLLLITMGFGLSHAAAWADYGSNPFLDAVRTNDEPAALRLLEQGVDVEARYSDGTGALHWAAYHGNAELIERLIAAGADVNVINEYGSTPLAEAAVRADTDIVRALLEAGADPESPNADGQTALMVVARTSQVDTARLLIEHGAEIDAREQWRQQTALMWAAAQNQPEMVKLLLEHGADPNARSQVNDWQRQVSSETRRMFRPSGGLTPLLLAAREGCAECVRHLVAAGADPNLGDPDNVRPLFLAVDNTHYDTARVLLEQGADPNLWDWWGRTPLYGAVDMITTPVGGRPDRRSADETTAIQMAEILLEAGADPNLQLKHFPPYRHISDDRGCDNLLTTGATPLLRAAKTFDTDAMRLLIDYGANLELPNDSGVTPLMAAAGLGSLECDPRGYGPGIPHYVTDDVQQASIRALEVLVEAGADVNARGSERRGRHRGQTALHGAAFWGWNDVVRYLVEQGARVDAEDASGRTAHDAAMGRVGGHGRGQTIEVFEDTAALVLELCQAQADCDPQRMAR